MAQTKVGSLSCSVGRPSSLTVSLLVKLASSPASVKTGMSCDWLAVYVAGGRRGWLSSGTDSPDPTLSPAFYLIVFQNVATFPTINTKVVLQVASSFLRLVQGVEDGSVQGVQGARVVINGIKKNSYCS